MEEPRSLWPSFALTPSRETPETLPQERAALLAENTGGLLRGEVQAGSHGDWLTLDLYVVAPRLDDYAYRICKVRHKLLDPFNPVEVVVGSKDVRRSTTSEQYARGMTVLLGSPETAAVIRELMALSSRAPPAEVD